MPNVGELFDAHHAALYRYLVRFCGDADLAADAAQEAFVRALERPPAGGATRAWLFTVATNVAMESADRQRVVTAALVALSVRERTALLPREEGFSHREIAATVGTTTGTVGTLIVCAHALQMRSDYFPDTLGAIAIPPVSRDRLRPQADDPARRRRTQARAHRTRTGVRVAAGLVLAAGVAAASPLRGWIVRTLLWGAPLMASMAPPTPIGAQGTPPAAAPHADAITAARMRADLMFLAGDDFRGRLTDTPENALALEWIKARFAWLGLAPKGEGGSYFAPYQLLTSSLGSANELSIDWGSSTSRYAVGGDFHPRFHSATGTASGTVVFGGFGISAPTLGHDDLAGDVRGKILLMLDNEPGANDSTSRFDGVVSSEHASQLRKTLAAQAKGAAGVLFVADAYNRRGAETFAASTAAYWPAIPARIPRYSLAAWVQQVHIPAGQVSGALAEQLVQGSGESLLALAREAERSHALLTLPGVRVTLTTDVARHVVIDRNVVAVLEGRDAALKDEYVIIAAHPDHNGADGGEIFNGADDNGSGTVGLLAIADAYARAAADGQRPRRSILFVALNSEERGPLMGAWGYVEAPPVPLDRTVAMLNMDMIGRNEEVPADGGARFRGLPVQRAESNRNSVNLYGYSRSQSLTSAIDRANGAIGLTLQKRYDNNSSQLLRRTDMWAFQQRGVPAVTFATGLHPDYHTTVDRPERIEYAKMERMVRLVCRASWDLADAPTRPRLDTR